MEVPQWLFPEPGLPTDLGDRACVARAAAAAAAAAAASGEGLGSRGQLLVRKLHAERGRDRAITLDATSVMALQLV